MNKLIKKLREEKWEKFRKVKDFVSTTLQIKLDMEVYWYILKFKRNPMRKQMITNETKCFQDLVEIAVYVLHCISFLSVSLSWTVCLFVFSLDSDPENKYKIITSVELGN